MTLTLTAWSTTFDRALISRQSVQCYRRRRYDTIRYDRRV